MKIGNKTMEVDRREDNGTLYYSTIVDNIKYIASRTHDGGGEWQVVIKDLTTGTSSLRYVAELDQLEGKALALAGIAATINNLK